MEKFSEFFGFSTRGFEMEILELMRNLVAKQKMVKKKGTVIVSKCERELRKPKSSVNYNGKLK